MAASCEKVNEPHRGPTGDTGTVPLTGDLGRFRVPSSGGTTGGEDLRKCRDLSQGNDGLGGEGRAPRRRRDCARWADGRGSAGVRMGPRRSALQRTGASPTRVEGRYPTVWSPGAGGQWKILRNLSLPF